MEQQLRKGQRHVDAEAWVKQPSVGMSQIQAQPEPAQQQPRNKIQAFCDGDAYHKTSCQADEDTFFSDYYMEFIIKVQFSESIPENYILLKSFNYLKEG